MAPRGIDFHDKGKTLQQEMITRAGSRVEAREKWGQCSLMQKGHLNVLTPHGVDERVKQTYCNLHARLYPGVTSYIDDE
jgi:hypothetical protein